MNPTTSLLIVLLAVAASACAGEPTRTGPTGPAPPPLADSHGGDPAPPADDPAAAPAPVSIPTAGGDWDGTEYSDVLVAPGFQFEDEHSYTNLQEGSRMADLYYHGTMAPADASSWFLTNMPAAGWKLTRYSGLTTKVIVFRKEEEEAMVSLSAADAGTRLRVMIHPAID